MIIKNYYLNSRKELNEELNKLEAALVLMDSKMTNSEVIVNFGYVGTLNHIKETIKELNLNINP